MQNLNKQLKAWATRHQSEDSSELVGRIQDAVRREGALDPLPLDRLPLSHPSTRTPWTGRIGWALAGASVASLLFLLISPRADVPDSYPIAQSTSELLKVFQEVETLFPGQAEWVASLGDDVQMGLRKIANEPSESSDASEESPGYAIEYLVLSKIEGGEWEESWRGDVVSRRPDICIENREFCLFVHTLEPGVFSVEQDIELPSPVPFVARNLQILHSGQPQEIARMEDRGRSWRLYQAIRPLTLPSPQEDAS